MGFCISKVPKTKEDLQADHCEKDVKAPLNSQIFAYTETTSDEIPWDSEELKLAPPFTPRRNPLIKKRSNFQAFGSYFPNGVFGDATIHQLEQLWERYVTSKNSEAMGEEELSEILVDYIEFCQELSINRVKRMKNDVKRIKNDEKLKLCRSKEEIDQFSKEGGVTLVRCNSLKRRISDKVMKWESVFENQKMNKSTFLRIANPIFDSIKKELKFYRWPMPTVNDSILTASTPESISGMEAEQLKVNNEFLQGILKIQVIGAIGLQPRKGYSSCSPYAILSLGSRTTATVFRPNTQNPEWFGSFKFTNYTFRKRSLKKTSKVKADVQIMDWDPIERTSEELCNTSFVLPNAFMQSPETQELVLRSGEKDMGFLTVKYELQPKEKSLAPQNHIPSSVSTTIEGG